MTRGGGVRRALLFVLVAGAGAPASLDAQSTATATAIATAADSLVTQAVGRARRLVETGEGDSARALLDSLVTAQESGSDALAEALHWRAALGENAREAERDWKRLVVEAPLSPRAPVAFLRLAELELLRGHPDVARAHLERMLRDHPADPARVKALLWIARSHLDEGNPASACAALAAPALASLPDGESALQASELRNRCTAAAAAAAVPASGSPTVTSADSAQGAGSTTPTTTAARGRFAVQLGAFPTRADADRAVRRLRARGIEARVSGTRKPYRVHTGRYTTRADATAALARLKKQGHAGFVTETGG